MWEGLKWEKYRNKWFNYIIIPKIKIILKTDIDELY